MEADVMGEILAFDHEREVSRITDGIRRLLRDRLHKRGLVVAVSGGVDSAVCCALAVRALGPERCFALLLPERESSPSSLARGRALVERLSLSRQVTDITAALEALDCYGDRDRAIRQVFPDYDSAWKSKIVIDGAARGAINHFRLVAEDPAGYRHEALLGLKAYLSIVAATNYKQRIRKNVEYFHADRLNYAVVGTPNRLEYDQGFFVKNGDGAADLKPIAHLYKSQVYALARYLDLPESICRAAPSTDTYSLSQGQDEFYYQLPYQQMDIALWCYNRERPAAFLAQALGVSGERAGLIYRDIAAKRRATAPLHWPPLLVAEVSGPLAGPVNLGEP